MYTRNELLNYVDSLANGVDPKTGELLDKDTILNRPDVIRMLYSLKEYISEYGPKITKADRIEFVLSKTDGIIESETTVSNFVKKINEINCTEDMKPLSYKVINAWLIKEGYLETSEEDNKKYPTEKGQQIGLIKSVRRSQFGIPYSVVVFNSNAQQFVLDKLSIGEIELDIKKYTNEE